MEDRCDGAMEDRCDGAMEDRCDGAMEVICVMGREVNRGSGVQAVCSHLLAFMCWALWAVARARQWRRAFYGSCGSGRELMHMGLCLMGRNCD